PLGAIGRERLEHLVATGAIGGDGEAERTAVLLARAPAAPAAGGAVATA
nr:hypothetical protein [Solirubrobacterales bacterium]